MTVSPAAITTEPLHLHTGAGAMEEVAGIKKYVQPQNLWQNRKLAPDAALSPSSLPALVNACQYEKTIDVKNDAAADDEV